MRVSDSTGSAPRCRSEVRLTDGRVLSTPAAPLEWDVVTLAASTFLLRIAMDVVEEAWDGAMLRVLLAGGSARAGDLRTTRELRLNFSPEDPGA